MPEYTPFGYQLVDLRGLISLVYDGYRDLYAHQTACALNACRPKIDGGVIARASIHFGEKTVDPLAMDLIKDLPFTGAICDLGCGGATRLMQMCVAKNVAGIGIECTPAAVDMARKNSAHFSNITIMQGNIADLEGVWEEVEVVTQFFVMHDITPDSKCIETIRGFRERFPNVKYLIYADNVRPSSTVPSQLPGFDYIHGLLGIYPRSYEETVQMFAQAGFTIKKECAPGNLPNTFVWLLTNTA